MLILTKLILYRVLSIWRIFVENIVTTDTRSREFCLLYQYNNGEGSKIDNSKIFFKGALAPLLL